jgi:hypothetical protein
VRIGGRKSDCLPFLTVIRSILSLEAHNVKCEYPRPVVSAVISPTVVLFGPIARKPSPGHNTAFLGLLLRFDV